MRLINQKEAEEMRSALKKIAGFYNPAQERDGGQMAALTARETLEKVGLLFKRTPMDRPSQDLTIHPAIDA